jgi:hypothetical protein
MGKRKRYQVNSDGILEMFQKADSICQIEGKKLFVGY